MNATTRALVAAANPRAAAALPALPTPPSRSDLTAFSAYVWPFLRAPRPLWFALGVDAAVFGAALIAVHIIGGGGPMAEIVPPANAAPQSMTASADDLLFAPPRLLEAPFAPVPGIPEATYFSGPDSIVASNPRPADEEPTPVPTPQRAPKLLAYASDTLASTGDRAARAREAIDDLLPGGRAIVGVAETGGRAIVGVAETGGQLVNDATTTVAKVTVSPGAAVQGAVAQGASSVVASTSTVTTVTKSTVSGAVNGVAGKLGLMR